LEKSLELLLDQDYPDYQLRLVVDDLHDPAYRVVRPLAERYGPERVHVETLDDRRTTCSLKCSSVTQAIERLDPSFEAVALIDADTVPHRSWLRELVAPLADESVGAATGNRWYMPEGGSWGALVRYLWNAAAVVQMYWYQVAWGGTLALRRSVIDELDLLGRWRKAFGEDTTLNRQLGRRGLGVKFVPALMMVNREECTVGDCRRWISRQLLSTRLDHPLWPLVVLHGLGTTLVLAAAVGATAVALLHRDWPSALWCAGGLLAYEVIMVGLLVPMEMLVRRIVRSRGGPTAWLSWHTLVRLVPAIALTQVVYTLALLGAQLARIVSWRGVHYRVRGSGGVERLDDPAFSGEAAPAARGYSL
jgi:hypothetical protein